MNVDKCNSYKDFYNVITTDFVFQKEFEIDELIQFFINNEIFLTRSFESYHKQRLEHHDSKFGDIIKGLSEKIRTSKSEEMQNKESKIRKLVKKMKVFGETRKITLEDSRGKGIISRKDILTEVVGFLEPKERKIAGSVSKEWRSFIKSPSVIIKSINKHPEIPIKEYGCQTIEDLIQLTASHKDKLKSLNLTGFIIDDNQLKTLIENCPSIHQISIKSHKITDNGLKEIAKLSNLQQLDLSCCNNITDEGLKEIAKLFNLQKLALESCYKITDNGLKEIAKLYTLQQLNLACCDEITDEGLRELASLFNLQQLDLGYCDKITDEGLKEIAKLFNLQKLNIESCYDITDKGLQLFQDVVILH